MLNRYGKVIDILLLFSILLITEIFCETKQKGADTFGEFTPEWVNFTLCRGPKANNLTEISTELKSSENGTTLLEMNAKLLTDISVDEIKTSVYRLEGDTTYMLFNIKYTDPCHNFVFAELIKQKMNTPDCHVKKGDYLMAFNLNKICDSFIGKRFYYGRYFMHSIFSMKTGNLLCVKHVVDIKKKM